VARALVEELRGEGLSAAVIGEVIDPLPGTPALNFG
jgi:hypothetical protein